MSFIFKDRSKRVVAEVTGRVKAGLERDFCEVMVEVAKEMSPHLTGNNASTIRWELKGFLKWWVFTESSYGGYLELGTKRMAARPYFAPAAKVAMNNVGAHPWR